MTPEQRRRVRDLFEAALDLAPADRAAWIDREADGDAAVRDEVRSLLEHDSRAGSFLQHPVLDRVPGLLDDVGLAPGTSVGPYSIVKEIGRGGMGRVYQALDRRLGRTVALKALAPHLTRDETHRERLRREAMAAAGLTHPGICTVYALEEIDGELYIACEFVEGRTLRDEIREALQSERRPPGAVVTHTAREIAAALASAHDRGITHRDLKPENVMRTTDGQLKILDFGLARVDTAAVEFPSATVPGMLIGTPGYMAPEQLNGQPVDRRADVFAFGVLLYEYAAGVHPFEAETPLATLARVLESEARPLADRRPELSATIADVIARCLRKPPPERFQTAADIVRALDRGGEAPSQQPHLTWWRVHQLVIIALYLASAALGWQLKEWLETPMTISAFIALGIGATVGSVLRGHMLFTERMNRPMLAVERRRTSRGLVAVDLALAVALTVDGILLAAWPLTSVLTISLALGIALAATVLEPATTSATFGEG